MRRVKAPCGDWCSAPIEFCKCCPLCYDKKKAVYCEICEIDYILESDEEKFCPKCGSKMVNE